MNHEQKYICPKCNNAVSYGVKFCNQCGHEFGEWSNVESTITEENNIDSQKTPKKNGYTKWVAAAAVAGIAFYYAFIALPSPESAVKEAISSGDIKPVIDLYDKSSDDAKHEAAYLMTDEFLRLSKDAFEKNDSEQHRRIMKPLAKLDFSNGKNICLGALNNLKKVYISYEYHSRKKAQESQKLSDYGVDISKITEFKKDTRDFYVAFKERSDGKMLYFATGYNEYPEYGYYGPYSYIKGYERVSDGETIAIIESNNGNVVSTEGLYALTVIRSGERSIKTLGGFEKIVPVYQYAPIIVDVDMQKLGEAMYCLKELKNYVKYLAKLNNVLKEKYQGMTHNDQNCCFTVDGIGLASNGQEFQKKFAGTKISRDDNGHEVYCKIGDKVSVSFDSQKYSDFEEVILNSVAFQKPIGSDEVFVEKGKVLIKKGSTIEEIETAMKGFYKSDIGGLAYRHYLMPNAQVVTFHTPREKLKDICIWHYFEPFVKW